MARAHQKKVGCHLLKKIGPKRTYDYQLYICKLRPTKENPTALCLKIYWISEETGETLNMLPGLYINHDIDIPKFLSFSVFPDLLP